MMLTIFYIQPTLNRLFKNEKNLTEIGLVLYEI